MTPALVQQLEQAELSVCDAQWPGTRYRTVRRLSNHESAEKAALTAEHFYGPLVAAVAQVERLAAAEGPQAAADHLGEILAALHAVTPKAP